MNVSYRWLRELAPSIDEPAEAIARRLTHTNVPVEAVTWLGGGLEELVVARVIGVAEHPRADRLVICQVDAGRDEPVQVVTGAPEVVEGAFYPFVGVGQTLPGGQQIKRVKLRGEASEGMLCSERELGVGRDQAGIMRMFGDYTPGQPLMETLERDDYLLELEVTPNRPDLLGHWGVARELAPGGDADLRLPDFPDQAEVAYEQETASKEAAAGGVTVRIEDPEGCPRYMGAVIRGVKVGPSPDWLANRLRAVGQQPINNVVDATNYVLQELSQPLHAFDLATLEGPAVVIRRAERGERLRTLDGRDRKLDPEMLVIADAEKPTAMAGLMGGEASEVTGTTRDVFLECAYFEPRRVRQAARRLELESDASYRFQRGIDPEGLPRALRRVVELILTVAGGRLDGPTIDVYARRFEPRVVPLRPSRVGRLLGIELEAKSIAGCLEPIGFRPSRRRDGEFDVNVPSWRPDVQREVDLIEEVARRYGYDRFPYEMRTFRPSAVPPDDFAEALDRIREVLVGFGYLEAISVPFVGEDGGEIRLLNPLSDREDHLRNELLTGLVSRVEHNFARGQRDVRLFEIGTAFLAGDGPLPDERTRVAAVFSGRRTPPHWTGPDEDWDIWDAKWLIENLGRLATPEAEVRPLQDGSDAKLEEALVLVSPEGEVRGWAGRVPAGRLDSPRWAAPVFAVELEVTPARPEPTPYRELPVYPAVERDLAVIVERARPSAEVESVIRDAAPDLLEGLSVFDVYEGENIPTGTRSIAWRLRFRSRDRTLTDDEVDAAMRGITSALEKRLNVTIRGA